MTLYTIDSDIMKEVLRCPDVKKVEWRLSPSRRGFHVLWNCKKRMCKLCVETRRKFDDPARFQHDGKRKTFEQNVLWSTKGTLKAGKWHVIERKENE